MGLGPSLPPVKLARRDSTLFVEVKRLFSTTSETEFFSKSSWIEPEANGGHWGDRMLNWTRPRYDQTRPVSGSSSQTQAARVLHQRVRSLVGPARLVRR
jgi:hypothetical protein